MTRRAILHSAPLLLAAATLLSACTENLTTDAGARARFRPGSP